MKKRNLFVVTIAMFIVFSSCEKSNTDCNRMPAKVIWYDWDRVVFQLSIPSPFGDPDWERCAKRAAV